MKCLLVGRRTRIDGLPRNDHGHHCGFPRTRGKLEGKTRKFRIGVEIGSLQLLNKSLAMLGLGCDFGQPDGCFDGLDLAEKRPQSLKLVMPPMLE